MELRNDNRMYSGGAVAFDSSPSVNMYAQLMAKKQAKIDALDEYDKQRINNINPNGVRDKDRQGFDKRVQQIQEFYIGNKDKIRKGGTPESYAYEKMFRDVGGYINQSKERTAKQDAAMKLYQERLKQDGRVPDDFIAELHENDLGIDDITGVDQKTGEVRRSKSLDLTKWLSQPKPFNQQTYLKSFSDIKRDSPRYEAIPGQPLKQNEITEFSKDALQVIHARAADKYQNSFSFAEQVKSEFADPVGRSRMEDIFKNSFGTNPQTPEDYATAFTLEMIQPKLSKTIDNKEAIIEKNQQFAKEQQARNHAASLQRLRESIAAGRIPWMNATQTASYVINADKTVGENQPVQFDLGKYETITGGVTPSSNSELRSDGKGGYIYGIKNTQGEFVEKGRVDAVTAQDRLTKEAAKNKVENPAIKTPKTDTPKQEGGMVTVILKDGRKGQIPSDKVAQFLKDNPGAKKQ